MKQDSLNSVWILILNWKNPNDTLDCLDSIINCGDAAIKGIVVCDNGSDDGSIEKIGAWFESKQLEYQSVKYIDNIFQMNNLDIEHELSPSYYLVDNGYNFGFAGGNNVGLRFICENLDYEYVYLLNNDTIINGSTVTSCIDRMLDDRKIGMCGSTVIYYHQQKEVQAFAGGSFNTLLGRSTHIGAHESIDKAVTESAIESQLDYILGAALMISKECLDSVGFLEEKYFLYYEEIDWATRAERLGFSLGFARDSKVWHKEGGSIGSSHDKAKRSYLSEYYLMSSRLKFIQKFYPLYLPTVYLYSLALVLRAVGKADFVRSKIMLRAILGLEYPHKNL